MMLPSTPVKCPVCVMHTISVSKSTTAQIYNLLNLALTLVL